eukprot:scpid86554/ scgid1491/ 
MKCQADQTQKYLRTGASGTPTRLKSTGSRATTRVVDSSISVAAEDTERCLHIRLVLRTAELRVSGAEVLPERMEMSAEVSRSMWTYCEMLHLGNIFGGAIGTLCNQCPC